MKVRMTSGADRDVCESRAWYDAEQSLLGMEYLEDFDSTMEAIRGRPRGCSYEETSPFEDREIRRRLFGRFNHRVIFEVLPSEIVVLAVVHNSRDAAIWHNRLDDSRS